MATRIVYAISLILLNAFILLEHAQNVKGHGQLQMPPARNVLANSDYCPHCLNGGGVGSVSESGTLQWPEGKHGICGDPFSGPRKHEYGGKFYTGKPAVSYAQGQVAQLEVFVSTNHNGRFRFRICQYRKNPFGTEQEQLTEECLDKHVLKQANVPGAQKPGEEWFYTTPGDPVTTEYITFYQLPEDLVCDGIKYACVLQFYWLSGNTCHPPGAPQKYKRPFAMPTCGSPNSNYPEEFWNCADIKISPADPMYLPLPPQALGSDAVLYPAEVATVKGSQQKTTRGVKDKTLVEKAAAQRFCTTMVNSYGMFANTGCHTYFLCTELGSWFLHCPPGLLFDSDTEICQGEPFVQCNTVIPKDISDASSNAQQRLTEL